MEENSNSRNGIIIAFIADLMSSSKIANIGYHNNYQIIVIEGESYFGAIGNQTLAQNPSEPVEGRNSALLNKITRWQPVLIIFDLDNKRIPWREWISILKSSPSSRRFPILCFGSHVNVEAMTDAKNRGADAVLARSRFFTAMPKLINKYSRIIDSTAVNIACQEPLPATAIQGLKAFNEGQYFLSHEILEDAWNEDDGPGRELYQAIIQIAVAYLQIERGNFQGSVKMFLRARHWLFHLPNICRCINVAQLRIDSEHVFSSLLELGPEKITEFDRTLFKPIQIIQGN